WGDGTLMASLGEFNPQVIASPAPAARIEGTLVPGLAQAAQGLGNVLETIAKKKDETDSINDGTQLLADTETALLTGVSAVDKSSTDHREFTQKSNEFVKDTMSSARERLAQLPDAQQRLRFGAELTRMQGSASTKIALRGDERFADEDRAKT